MYKIDISETFPFHELQVTGAAAHPWLRDRTPSDLKWHVPLMLFDDAGPTSQSWFSVASDGAGRSRVSDVRRHRHQHVLRLIDGPVGRPVLFATQLVSPGAGHFGTVRPSLRVCFFLSFNVILHMILTIKSERMFFLRSHTD